MKDTNQSALGGMPRQVSQFGTDGKAYQVSQFGTVF